ncbi:MAG: hypothetical protein WBZ29_14480 [Methanocella sp.]|jgi:hypothetical protein
MSAVTDTDTVGTAYRGLYIIGGAAALIAGLNFRRNPGPCPFAPCSDASLRSASLKEALLAESNSDRHSTK